jgi:pantothenate kinase
MFKGLAHLISGSSNFEEILQMAHEGNNRNTDYYVEDIYSKNAPPSDIKGNSLCISYSLIKYYIDFC